MKKPKDWGDMEGDEDEHHGEEDEHDGYGVDDDDDEGSEMNKRPMWKKWSGYRPTGIFAKIRHYTKSLALRLKKIIGGHSDHRRHHHRHHGVPPRFRRV